MYVEFPSECMSKYVTLDNKNSHKGQFELNK